MPRIADTYQFNQWPSNRFWNQVDQDEAQEVRIAAAYDRPIDTALIRAQVISAILSYAIPAGNA